MPSSTPDNELIPGVGILPGAFRDGITFMEVRTVEPLTVTYLKSELAAYIREREAKLVRDAGAVDDSYGAEDWTYSDDRIDQAERQLKKRERDSRIRELNMFWDDYVHENKPLTKIGIDEYLASRRAYLNSLEESNPTEETK